MEPFVLRNHAQDWPPIKWQIENLEKLLADSFIDVRFGPKRSTHAFSKFVGKILFDCKCRSEKMSCSEFLKWLLGESVVKASVDGDNDITRGNHWAYYDYKYTAEVMLNEAKKELNWKKLGVLPEGYEDQDDDSALWIGTSGAYTPCHYDTYGFNIHVQLKGTKRWILFPPEDDLMPTRIPYEESSVFSRLDIIGGDERLKNFHPRVIYVNEGDVLFVPPKWWHSVQCVPNPEKEKLPDLDVSMSVNRWFPCFHDDFERVKEAVVFALFTALEPAEGSLQDHYGPGWLLKHEKFLRCNSSAEKKHENIDEALDVLTYSDLGTETSFWKDEEPPKKMPKNDDTLLAFVLNKFSPIGEKAHEISYAELLSLLKRDQENIEKPYLDEILSWEKNYHGQRFLDEEKANSNNRSRKSEDLELEESQAREKAYEETSRRLVDAFMHNSMITKVLEVMDSWKKIEK